MTRNSSLTLALLLALGLGSLAGAAPFNNPPEANVPPGGWETPFPYQRNVTIDFATPPDTWPPDSVNGYDLLPGLNCQHSGTDDAVLYPSDWISLSSSSEPTGPGAPNGLPAGPVPWFPDMLGRMGLIGFYNTEAVQLDMTIHLDNWPIERSFKHVWVEMEYYVEGAVGLSAGISGPGGPSSQPPIVQDLGDGWYRMNMYAEIQPNPPWEEFHFSGWIDPAMGGSLLVDYVHIATECVPEPASLSLLGLGGLTLLRRRRARRNCPSI